MTTKNLDVSPAKLKVWLRLNEQERLQALDHFVKKDPTCLTRLEKWVYVDTFLEEVAIRFLLARSRDEEPTSLLIKLANCTPRKADKAGNCAFSKATYGVGALIVCDIETDLRGLACEATKFMESIGLETPAIKMPAQGQLALPSPKHDDSDDVKRSIRLMAKDVVKYFGSVDKMIKSVHINERRTPVVKRIMKGSVQVGSTCKAIEKAWHNLYNSKEDFIQQLKEDGYKNDT